MDEFLHAVGFAHLNQDHNLYLYHVSVVILYVDDILIFGHTLSTVTTIKKSLPLKYSMVDLGKAKHYLGIYIKQDHNAHTIYLNQTRYITKILKHFSMQDCKGISTPIATATFPPCPIHPTEAITWMEYQSEVGKVMYTMLGTHPDLTFAVSAVSKPHSCPITAHHLAMGRVLRYPQATENMEILYKGEANSTSVMPEPICYTDSWDWAGDRDKCQSTSGFFIVLCGGAVSWKTRKQDIVALSTTEAEYISLTEASKEVIWMCRLLNEIGTDDSETYSTDM